MATVSVNIISRADTSGIARMSRSLSKMTAIASAATVGAAGAAQAVAVIGTAAASVGMLAAPALGAVLAGLDGIKAAAGTIAPQFDAFKAAMSSSFAGASRGFGQLGGVLGAITPQMQGVGAAITGVFNGLAGTVARNTTGLQALAAKSGEFVTKLGPGLNTLVEKMIQFGASINVDGVIGVFKQLWSLLQPIITLFQQLAAAAGPFGSTLGILGGIITAITPALVQVAQVLGPVLAESMIALTPAISQVAAAFAQVVAAVAPVLPVVAGLVASLVSGLGPALPAIVGALLAFGVAVKAASVGIAAYNAVARVVRVVTAAWAAVQWLLNSAILANPLTWIVIAIIALIAVIVLIATKTTWFQTIWQTMCNVVKAVWNAVWTGIKAVFDGVMAAIQFVIAAFVAYVTMYWNVIKFVAQAVWQGIQMVVTMVVNVIKAIITGLGAAISAVWNAIKATASAVWNGIRTVVSTVAGVIRSAVTGAVNTVIAIFNRVKSVGETVWGGIRGFIDGVASAIQSVIGFVSDLIGKLSSISLPSWLPFSGTGLGVVAHMAPPPTSQLQLAAGFPSVAGLGGLGGGGRIVVDQSITVHVDGSGIVDEYRVASEIERVLARYRRTTTGVTQ